MSSFPSKKILLVALFTFILQVSGSPVAAPKSHYAEHALRRRANLEVRDTTQTAHNTIDWIALDSQGAIATPPAPIATAAGNFTQPISELQLPGASLGPPGTVPIPQISPDYLANAASKGLPEIRSSGSKVKSKRQDANDHWYSTSDQSVSNTGGSAIYSMYEPFVNNNADFSLLQTAISHESSQGDQTIEAGWYVNSPV